jgi:radical SAM protein with 4Fe4S-binding SPASM domain
MAELCEVHLVTDSNLQEIWQQGKLFVEMRKSLLPLRCSKCTAAPHCMSGCPVFPENNICNSVIEDTAIKKAMKNSADVNGDENQSVIAD